MNTPLLLPGVGCVIAAVVGGGCRAVGLVLPVIQSTGRQLMLGAVGVALILAAWSGSPTPHNLAQPMRDRLIGRWCGPSGHWDIRASGSDDIHTSYNDESLGNVWSVIDLGNKRFEIVGMQGGTRGQEIIYRFVTKDFFELDHASVSGILTTWKRCE